MDATSGANALIVNDSRFRGGKSSFISVNRDHCVYLWNRFIPPLLSWAVLQLWSRVGRGLEGKCGWVCRLMLLGFVDGFWVLVGIPILWCSAIPMMPGGAVLQCLFFCCAQSLPAKTPRWFWEACNTCILHAHARNNRLQRWPFCISVGQDRDGRAVGDDSACSESHDWTRTSEPIFPAWCFCFFWLTYSDAAVL